MCSIVTSIDSIDWKNWQPAERATLCFLLKKNNVLLIHKKTGLGAGKISGPGGRLEKGETSTECVVRELEEEVGMTPISPKKMGELSFVFSNGYSLHGTIFTATAFTGSLIETDEAKPFWCDRTKIPFDNMWEDDPYWLPSLLNGQQIRAFFYYDDDALQTSRVFIFQAPP